MKKIIFINSHPIQYFAPLYKYLNQHGVQTKVWYCSDKTLKKNRDKEFGVEVNWDIPLLEGYPCRFFKNILWNASHANGFFGLINLGLLKALFVEDRSIIVVHGWHYFTHFFALLLAKFKGHTVCLRSEMPYKQELLKKGWKQNFKRIILKNLFKRIDYFLYIGLQNKLFYESYGIKKEQLLFCPYSVDNAKFQMESRSLIHTKVELKEKLGILNNDPIILFVGKYIQKKRPLDVLKAKAKLKDSKCWLIMVGEGELRGKMEKFIADNDLERVILTGFINQSEISKFYAVSDVFVMSSELGETWGLAVNEAMNFNLPLVISDLTGCADDLVKNNENGYTYETGNYSELSSILERILFKGALANSTSKMIIKTYDFSTFLCSIQAII